MEFFFSKKLQPYRSESIIGFSLVILHNFFRKAIHSLEHLRTVVKIRHKQLYLAESLKLVMKTCSIKVKKKFLSSMFISNVKLVVTLFSEKSGNFDWFKKSFQKVMLEYFSTIVWFCNFDFSLLLKTNVLYISWTLVCQGNRHSTDLLSEITDPEQIPNINNDINTYTHKYLLHMPHKHMEIQSRIDSL